MQLLFLLYNICLVKSLLLTHKAIGEKIADIQGLFKEKQKEWFKKNKNNELVLIDYVGNSDFAEIIEPIITKYLKETTDTSVYVVAFIIIHFNNDKYNTVSLAKYAGEIIKECVKTNKPYKRENDGLIWECWKIAPDDDYKKLKEQKEIADVIYIDGFYNGHDSYEEFISHYLYNYRLTRRLYYQFVINLQKTIENNTTYMDITEISQHLKKNKSEILITHIVKFLNCNGEAILNTVQQDQENEFFVIGNHYLIEKIQNNIDIEVSQFICDEPVPKFKYIQKFEHEQYKINMSKNLNHIKMNKFINLDLKIINYDAIKIYTQTDNVYKISFTTFVNEKKEIQIVQANTKNKYEKIPNYYEAVIIVSICALKNKFRHIITYPVLDVNGQFPVKNYDTEDIYYMELRSQHDKVQKMLDTIYDIYQNDCIIDDQKSFILHRLLDIEEKCSGNYAKITDELESENTDIPYHQQNIEFIKNLQSKFGENIDIELYNIVSDNDIRRKIYSFSCYCDFKDHYSYKNKIDTKTYLETEHNDDNNDVVLMILNIKNTKDEISTYYLIHDTYTSQESLDKYFRNYSNEMCHELKTKTEKELFENYGNKKAIEKNYFNKAIYEHLVSKIPVIIKHIEDEYDKFIEINYYFYQKLLLNLFKIPINLSNENNNSTNQPSSNGSYLNNTNATNNQEADKINTNKQQNIPNFEFITCNYAKFNEIYEFTDILLRPLNTYKFIIMKHYYKITLESMWKILVKEILEKKNIKLERSRKLYLKVKQVTASMDDYDKLTKCINETFA